MNLDDLADRDAAEQVPCPPPPLGCSAVSGQTCRNLTTGEELAHQPAHAARIRAAGVVHAPIDPRELRAPHERTPR